MRPGFGTVKPAVTLCCDVRVGYREERIVYGRDAATPSPSSASLALAFYRVSPTLFTFFHPVPLKRKGNHRPLHVARTTLSSSTFHPGANKDQVPLAPPYRPIASPRIHPHVAARRLCFTAGPTTAAARRLHVSSILAVAGTRRTVSESYPAEERVTYARRRDPEVGSGPPATHARERPRFHVSRAR